MKRAERRYHKRRMKARARKIFTVSIFDTRYSKRHEKLADHLAFCSKQCCGNPRRLWNELTLQERRFYCEAE